MLQEVAEFTAFIQTGSILHITSALSLCLYIYIFVYVYLYNHVLFLYTPLYKVQLYITSFTQRHKLSDFLVHRDLPQELYLLNQNVFTSST